MKTLIAALAFTVAASGAAFATDASEGGIALNLRSDYNKTAQTSGFRPTYHFKIQSPTRTERPNAFSQNYSQASEAGIAPTLRGK